MVKISERRAAAAASKGANVDVKAKPYPDSPERSLRLAAGYGEMDKVSELPKSPGIDINSQAVHRAQPPHASRAAPH